MLPDDTQKLFTCYSGNMEVERCLACSESRISGADVTSEVTCRSAFPTPAQQEAVHLNDVLTGTSTWSLNDYIAVAIKYHSTFSFAIPPTILRSICSRQVLNGVGI